MKLSYTIDEFYNMLSHDENLLSKYLILCASIAAKNDNLKKEGDFVEFSCEYVDGRTLKVTIEIV